MNINYYLLESYIPGDGLMASKLGHLPKYQFAKRMHEYFYSIEKRIKNVTRENRLKAIDILWDMYGGK